MSARYTPKNDEKNKSDGRLKAYLDKIASNPDLAMDKKKKVDAILEGAYKKLLQILRGVDETTKTALITWYLDGPAVKENGKKLEVFLEKAARDKKAALLLKSQLDSVVSVAEQEIEQVLDTLDPTAKAGIRSYLTKRS